MNELTAYEDDGFGSSLQPSDRLLRGAHARWTDAKRWHDRDGLPIPSPLLVVGSQIALQRWKDKVPEVITGKPLPDPTTLNDQIPVDEWEMGIDGKPRPPYQTVFALYMVEWQVTNQLYTAVNSTTGWRMAFEALQEQVAIKRMLHGGARLLPIVDLQSRPFKTNYGDRMRPHLQVLDWKSASGGAPLPATGAAPQLSAPAPKSTKETLDAFAKPASDAHPAEATTNLSDNVPKAVSSEEFFDDSIPY